MSYRGIRENVGMIYSFEGEILDELSMKIAVAGKYTLGVSGMSSEEGSEGNYNIVR